MSGTAVSNAVAGTMRDINPVKMMTMKSRVNVNWMSERTAMMNF